MVTSLADNTNADYDFTLREAIMLANGGTGQLGLNRALSDGEFQLAIIAGCELTGSGEITNYCGQGFADTIYFSNALPSHAVITLKSPLVALIDWQPTTLDGAYSNIRPQIDAAAIGSGFDGLVIGSAGSVVKGVTVMNSPRWNLNIYADDVQLYNINVWNAGEAGMSLRGHGIVVDDAWVGVGDGDHDTSCGSGASDKGNGQEGILIHAIGAYVGKSITVKDSVIGCNGKNGAFAGVRITGNGVGYNGVKNNFIGVNSAGGGDLANTGDGVRLDNGAAWNVLVDNNISGNFEHGVALIDATHSAIDRNTIRNNGLDGLYLAGAAQQNEIGGIPLGGQPSGNLISANWRHGVELSGGQVQYNTLGGNKIGVNAAADAADGNNLSGVYLDGAAHNTIGSVGAGVNIIAGNKQHGVALVGGASQNSVIHSDIGLAGALAIPNFFSGVVLDAGAYNNTIGGVPDGTHNRIGYNSSYGVVLQGASTAYNTLLGNLIVASGSDGVAIRNGAHHNIIGDGTTENDIDSNLGQGIHLSGGAHDNFVLKNDVTVNGLNGIQLDGAGTTGNHLSQLTFLQNELDAINERDGADNNSWSQLNTGVKYGLPVDKNATSDTTNLSDAPVPSIQAVIFDPAANTFTANGQASPANPAQVVKVELYVMDSAQTYIASAAVDFSGGWSVTFNASGLIVMRCFAAFETRHNQLNNSDISSELGATTCMTKLDQTITFAPLPDRTIGDAPFTVAATASSGLPVYYTADTPQICTVDTTSGLVTLLAAGQCSILASQDGNDFYNTALDVAQMFQVHKLAQTITFTPLPDHTLGDPPFTVTASASSGLPVHYTPDTPQVCAVDHDFGLVTLVAVGECSINAAQDGDATYENAVDGTQVFQVKAVPKQNQAITFPALSAKTVADSPFLISASASSGLPVSLVSSTPAVCTVAGKTVTLVGMGQCTLVATQPGDGSFDPAVEVAQSFQVNGAEQLFTAFLPLVARE